MKQLTRTVNLRHSRCDVRIDRMSKWGNPFILHTHGTRVEVIEKYKKWVVNQPELMAVLYELEGMRLGCWCAPEACHGDVLIELLNEELRNGEII